MASFQVYLWPMIIDAPTNCPRQGDIPVAKFSRAMPLECRLALGLLSLLSLLSIATAKPNVLFIAIDDLRPELSCYGHKHIISPNIDRLAKEGVRFDRAYCQQSVCNPSRASVLTGLRPDATQVHGNHTHYRDIHPDIVTLPQHFKNHGYHTQALGKIYHGVFPKDSSKTVADTYDDPISWSVPAFRPGPRYYYTKDGIAAAKKAFLAMYRPVDPGPNDWTKKLVFGPITEAPGVPDETLYDGLVAERAIETLRELAQNDQPFFLAVGFIKPHTPFIAPKKYWDLYNPDHFDLASNPSAPQDVPKIALHGSGEIRRYTDQPNKGAIPEANLRRMKHGYAACISYVDAQVGKVLNELDQLGLRENTIVVLWSDHGYHLGEKNLWGKTTNFELDTRVAMMVHAPGRKGNGQATKALVELVDLYPTLVDLAELPAPPHTLQGKSFLAVMDDPSRSWKQAAFSQFTRREHRGYSLTDGRYRYTEWVDLTSGTVSERELYDHQVDPAERRNLVSDQDNQETLRRLSTLLAMGEGWRHAHPHELQLGRPFGSHMVLQRDKPVPVYGHSAPGTTVRVAFGGQERMTKADAHGKWLVTLDAMPANTASQHLVVCSGEHAITLEDVLVGEVWLCAGQSNMHWMLKQSRGAKQAIATASNPNIRLLDFTATLYPHQKRYSLGFLRSIGAGNYYATKGWRRCSPETAATFSAVAYYFGDKLQKTLKVPVGLIHNAVGGIPMESYIPTTNSSGWLDDPSMPAWCRERGRENLAAWLEQPAAPAPHHPFEPGFLFEAGMRPLVRMALRGFLWYQGESNATASGPGSPAIDPATNKKKFVSLIDAWRKAWDDSTLPFYFVQLPGLNRDWPSFREMQLEVSQEVPHTGMAVTIDVGHPTNVHPTDKRPVGHRLAKLALASGTSPTLKSVAIDRSAATLRFSSSLATSDSQPPRGFAIAGEDQVFHPTTAKLENDLIFVTSNQVANPKSVRYGWANDPKVNLIGKDGLPVSPFRTDRWPITTITTQSTNIATHATYSTGFEQAKAEPFTELPLGQAVWKAEAGHAQITARFSHRGKQCLHLRGGMNRAITLTLKQPTESGMALTFQAERWTSRSPYTFRIESLQGEEWKEIYRGDEAIRVGRPFLSAVKVPLPKGTTRLRFIGSAPPNSGTLIDDVAVKKPMPMRIDGVSVVQQVNPVLIGKEDNPVLAVHVRTVGSLEPKTLRSVKLRLPNTEGIAKVRVFHKNALFGKAQEPKNDLTIEGKQVLANGLNVLRVSIELTPTATLSGDVDVHFVSLDIDGVTHKAAEVSLTGPQRIGVAVRTAGQDDCHTYRIPGLATTKQGSLIAVYDNRYRGSGDLPGDIDVGMSRSTDGGQTWEPMKVIMDMGNDPNWRYDGIGDPSILVDRVTGRIWVTGTWSHGDRSWHGSGPGLEPEETGQFMLVYSDDDGRSWSEPRNITKQIKKPEWRFVLQGPGKGITMRDGTLVFPAQFRSENAEPLNGKPFSTLIYSKDRGETWTIGAGVKTDTTEAQLIELADGSIMINCRDNRNRGLPDGQNGRTVAVTKDLGKTWEPHPTDRKALPEPTCMASLIRIEHEKHGPLLVFSNPATGQGRFDMTIKVSNDEGMTWPKKWHTLYDARNGAGYSCLTQVGDDHVGVLYEGVRELYFLKFSIEELLQGTTTFLSPK